MDYLQEAGGFRFRFQRVSSFRFQVSGGFRGFQEVSEGFKFQEVSSFRGASSSSPINSKPTNS